MTLSEQNANQPLLPLHFFLGGLIFSSLSVFFFCHCFFSVILPVSACKGCSMHLQGTPHRVLSPKRSEKQNISMHLLKTAQSCHITHLAPNSHSEMDSYINCGGKTALSGPITVTYVYVRIFIHCINVRTLKAAMTEMDYGWAAPQRVISSDV